MGQDEIKFDRHFMAVWRAKWLIILVVLLASAVTWWVVRTEPASHGATAVIRIGRVWKEPLEDPYITEKAVNSAGFFQELAARIGGNASHLKRRIRAEVLIGGARRDRYPVLLSIASTADNADEAVRLARAATDEIIARHQGRFDDALTPYRERERLLTAQLKESAASREVQWKLELELNQVQSNNMSPIWTEKTHLIEPIVAEPTARPSPLRSVATIALISAMGSVAVAALVGHFRTTSG
jgi:hypothetical protein